jgi:hypothetical protein
MHSSIHLSSKLIKFLGYVSEEEFLLETVYSRRCPDFMGNILDSNYLI